MANTVIALKKSATPSSAPADLANGELAINYADGKLFYKNTSGQIAEISGAVSSASFGTVNAAGTLLIADTTNDVLTIDQGDNIIITGDAINDKFTITANLTPANNWANTLAVSINAHALETATSIGTAGNNYTNDVGSSSNIFSQSVGTAGNNYTNAVGTAGNNYTILVGSSANNWANTKLSNTTNVWFSGNLNISEDLYIGRNITNVTQLVFNTGTNIVPTTPGALTWSQDDLTLRFDMDSPSNVIQHIGQDLFYLVKNQTGSTISKGTVVRFAGTLGVSGRLLIAPAIANNSYPSKYIMGVAAASINDGDDGFVLAQGKLKQIDTSMFSAGDILYVSSTTPGAFSNTMPTAPNNKVTVAAVVKSDNNGTLEVRLTLGSKLNEDELVELSSLANGDVIIYNSAHGHFENKPQSDINAGLLDGYNTSSSNVSNTVVVRDQWGNFSAGNITCSLSNTGTIDMRLSASDPGQVEGRIWYDGTLDHALNYYTDITGVSVAMGRQQVFRVRNVTANTFTVGQAVYASGGSVSKVPDIDLAISNDLLKSQVIGVVFGANIGPNSFGYVLAMGTYVHGDTNAYGAEGTRLYLSPTTPGALQNTIPPAPYHPVQIGVVTYQNNTQGTILISSIQRLSGLNLANGSIGFLVDGTQARIGEDNANLRFDTSNTTLHVAKANVGSLFVGSINVEPAFAAVNNHISGVGSSGNAYALSTATTIGTAGNNYTNAVGTAGNNYSLSIVTASNNYAIGTYVKLTAPSQTITGDFSITGNLFIGGNTTSVSANNLIVNDPLIYLANNNVSDTLDIGFVGSYYNVSSAHVHTGLYRDHVSKQYYLFQGYDANPDNNNEITPYSNNMVNATLVADLITSNLTLGGANAIVLIKSAYDSSNSGLAAGNAYALSTATSVGTAGNNYTNAVGAAGNAYTLSITTSVGDAGNNYTNTVGVSGNNYATAVGSGANNYLLGVTTAGNNYALGVATSVGAAGNNYTLEIGTAGNNYTVAVSAAGNAYALATATTIDAAGNNYAIAIGASANNWANTKLANTSGITFNGDLNVSGNLSAESTTFFVNGITNRVGIGRTDPGYSLDVVGTVNVTALLVNGAPVGGGGLTVGNQNTSSSTFYPLFTSNTSGSIATANVDSTDLYFVPSTGTLSAKIFNSLSDRNLKDNVETFDGRNLIKLISPVTFIWKDNGNKSYGVIAQELEKVLPELVETNEQGVKSVSYMPLIAILLDVIQKQGEEIKEIKQRLNMEN